jgi:hypothetical protein
MHASDVRDADDEAADAEDATTVSAHESCPGTTVFTEEGNSDGWIATDTTVPVDD